MIGSVRTKLFKNPRRDAGEESPNLSGPADFEEEPDAPFRLVDPCFQKACGSHVVLFIAQVVSFAHRGEHCPVVFAQFGDHVERIDILRIVIAEALEAANVSDGANGAAAQFAHALGYVVGHRKNLAAMLIEQEMVIPKVRPTHVPMKILGLQVQSKYVGQQGIESAADVLDGFGAEFIGCRERSLTPRRDVSLESLAF